MKARLFSVCILVVGLALALTWAVTAQQQQPASGGAPSRDRLGVRATSAVTLGQPGLSFRYMQTFGVTEQPYIADAQHLNAPNGIFIDDSDNLYVVEERGARMLKFNSAGSNLLSIGRAGVNVADDDSFESPVDVAVDSSNQIWVVDRAPDRVVQYDASGSHQGQLGETWTSGTDNTHFNDPCGIAFDSAGRMYVSDTGNHRIQVYTFTLGSPVYSATIGVTGISGTDNAHFNQPYHIAIDSSDTLYVADAGNHRVQIFDSNHAYVATIGASGVPGSDNSHFNWPTGVHVSGGKIYVADRENWRAQIFNQTTRAYQSTISTGWGWGNNQFAWPLDVATDSAGNIYVADHVNHRVQKFNSSSVFQSTFAGVTRAPYLTDGYHYNHPRVAIDGSGNIIIVEEYGQRLMKLDANGVFQWAVGQPGVDGDDNAHFNWPHGVAVGRDGRIYVADGCRVQILSGSGSYIATLGTGCGTGDYQFDWAAGISVDDNGYIYVADYPNHRVQIYNSNRVFVGRIGATGQCSSTNDRLCEPIGIEVDPAGSIYVADGGNCRVQKFNSSRVYQMTFGTTGSCTDSLSDISAEDVTVDAQGRVYVSEWAHDRVQVFDSSGAYLTTIGGAWGSNSSQFRFTSGVAVDSAGNVYVSDSNNSRIQKFAPGVPGWRQVNINGFGDRQTERIMSAEVFSGQLYAGTMNYTSGGQIWRTADAITWTAVTSPGFGTAYTDTNPIVSDIIEFDGQLYAGTGSWSSDGMPGQIWRSPDGATWSLVEGSGFGNANNINISHFGVFSNTLYAATRSSAGGLEIWRSNMGNVGDWTRVVANGNGDADNYACSDLLEFDGYFYAAVENVTDGAEIWRTNDGLTWARVITGGFGDIQNKEPSNLAILGNYLYVGTNNYASTGAQLWRSNDGTTWTQVMGNGFGDSNNSKTNPLVVFDGALYASVYNGVTGAEVWRSSDGTTWSQVNLDGFGDSNNARTSGVAVFNNRLFIGTGNDANGGEVWQFVGYPVYLPLVVRNR